ncbi:MAG: fumarylacetoacetate hydrolase family protein [Aquisalimonadaceae bacterium]
MKLLRYGPAGNEKPGMLDSEGRLRALSGLIDDINPTTLEHIDTLRGVDVAALPLVEGEQRLGAPVSGIGKLVCVGLNYEDHARESGAAIPKEPVLFMKATTAITGPNDPVLLPPGSRKSDWEVELAIVIGRVALRVSEADALAHVAGYTVMNDVSEREYQLERSGQWTKGKSFDTFAPIGPWLVSADEVPDPQALGLWLNVNGERMQTGSTTSMIFGVRHLVSYISHCMTLLPGDVISTGTPPGVGLGIKPEPIYLRAGDVMTLGVDGLGEQRQEVRPL